MSKVTKSISEKFGPLLKALKAKEKISEKGAIERFEESAQDTKNKRRPLPSMVGENSSKGKTESKPKKSWLRRLLRL